MIPGPALLFCPADRPDRFAKAAAAADAVILDLEDGVAPDDKPRARRALQETLLDPRRTIVRINPAGTDDATRDLDALVGTPYGTVMLAKAEDAEQAAALAPRQVIALCETADMMDALSVSGIPAHYLFPTSRCSTRGRCWSASSGRPGGWSSRRATTSTRSRGAPAGTR